MKLNSLKIKNILSFGGDKEICVDFSKIGMGLIIGDNGFGKSNFTRIIKMVLYFDYPSKIEKVVNDRKVSGEITCEVESKGNIYRLEYVLTNKKIKSVLVYKNNKTTPEDTGTLASTKDFILNEIVDIPKDVFYNVFTPSIDTFKSFIGMSVDDSRKIRDELFSLSDINKYNELTKTKLNKLISDETLIKNNIDINKESIDELKESIEKTKKEIDKDREDKLKLVNKEIESLEKQLVDNDRLKESYKKLIDAVNENIDYNTKLSNREKLSLLKKEKEQLIKIVDSLKLDKTNKTADLKSVENYEFKLIFEESEARLVVINKKINLLKEDILEMEQKNEKYKKWEKINEFIDLDNKKKEIEKEIENFKRVGENINKKLNGKDVVYQETKSELLQLKKEIEIMLLGEKCPTCESELSFSQEQISTKKDIYNIKVSEFNKFKEEFKKLVADNVTNAEALNNNDKKLSNLLKDIELLGEISTEPISGVITKEEHMSNLKLIVNNKTDIESLFREKTAKEVWVDKYKEFKNSVKPEFQRYQIEAKITEIDKSVEENVGKVGSINNDIKKYEDSLEGFIEKFNIPNKNDCLKKLDILLKKMGEINKEIDELYDTKNNKLGIKENLESKKTDNVLKTMEEHLNKSTNKINEEEEKLIPLKKQIEIHEAMKFIFSESGMKRWLLNKIRVGFSSNINRDLDVFGLSVSFDENFVISIFKNKRDLDQKLMSVGQRKIIDTIICLNFIELYINKIKDMNFCILDECLSNLSKRNSELLVEIIKNKLIPKNFNVMLTNHAPISNQMFDFNIMLENKFEYTEVKYV